MSMIIYLTCLIVMTTTLVLILHFVAFISGAILEVLLCFLHGYRSFGLERPMKRESSKEIVVTDPVNFSTC